MPNIDTTDAHATFIRRVYALNERSDGALAGAALTDDSRERATADSQRNVPQRDGTRAIAEGHVFELDVASGGGMDCRMCDAVPLQIHDLEQPVCRDESILHSSVGADQRQERAMRYPSNA